VPNPVELEFTGGLAICKQAPSCCIREKQQNEPTRTRATVVSDDN
jgi:hypothetical protein